MASTTRPRNVLRIAVIHDKHIQQERLIKTGQPVTIGSDPHTNTFVVPEHVATGESFALFDAVEGAYCLRFTSSFGGKSKVARKTNKGPFCASSK